MDFERGMKAVMARFPIQIWYRLIIKSASFREMIDQEREENMASFFLSSFQLLKKAKLKETKRWNYHGHAYNIPSLNLK